MVILRLRYLMNAINSSRCDYRPSGKDWPWLSGPVNGDIGVGYQITDQVIGNRLSFPSFDSLQYMLNPQVRGIRKGSKTALQRHSHCIAFPLLYNFSVRY